MIADHISNAKQYFGLGHGIRTALQYVNETDFNQLEPGKYVIDEEDVFAMVQEYRTLPSEECPLEAHKKYIDVQYIVDGAECIGYEPLSEQEVQEPYNEQDDYWLFVGDPLLMRYTKSMFGIFYPQDLHQPRVISGRSMWVRKVVVKVKI